jgi:regulatory protein
VREVEAQLERHGVASAVQAGALATLAEEGLLDDTRFARLFVEDKRRLEQWGRERILRGLLSRGIDRELAESVLHAPADPGVWAALEEPESELQRAVALLRRRYPAAPRDHRERERALGLLLRKGYESELALDALAAYARGD